VATLLALRASFFLSVLAAAALGCSASGSSNQPGAGGSAASAGTSAGGTAGAGGAGGQGAAGGGGGTAGAFTCELSAEEPSNLGCEFYAVDLDLSDGVTDPASGAWAVVLANGGTEPVDVTIEKNDAPFGQPPSPVAIHQTTIQPDALEEVEMPTREVDCAAVPGDWNSPGTCLSRNAFRIVSTAPIVVYQFNNVIHGWSTDASLLLPTSSLGTKYRVTGWPVAHSFPSPGAFVQRSYVTVVGTAPGTSVTVEPSWRIKGNDPVPATAAGDTLTMTLGPFDVLNLESDDSTLQECLSTTPPYCADLTGTAVDADQPVVVFSGTEQSGVGVPEGAPLPPGWNDTKGCCNQHLEEQLMPVESYGKNFIVTRSPIRSDPQFTSWEEPDVLRFVGAAAAAEVHTNLPAPLDSFTLQPGEVRDTWSQKDIIVSASEPIVVAQFLIGEDYVEPTPKGDPSFTIFPPIEQARSDYVFLSPSAWKENWVVIATETITQVTIDGAVPTNCTAHLAGNLEGKDYEARRCPLAAGAHRLKGDGPFQIMAYGYSDADAYSFAGGANIKKIYAPPPLF
jgi:hypothetical protein